MALQGLSGVPLVSFAVSYADLLYTVLRPFNSYFCGSVLSTEEIMIQCGIGVL